MKNSPHKDKHNKKKAIKETNHILENRNESKMPAKKWPYHVDHEEAAPVKHHKKTAKKSSPSEVHEQTEPAVVQHESPRWNEVKQRKVLEESTRFNKKNNTQKSSDKPHGR